MPQIALKEEAAYLGTQPTIERQGAVLGKPPGQVNLKLVQEAHIARHERTQVRQVVAQGRDALGANAKGEAGVLLGVDAAVDQDVGSTMPQPKISIQPLCLQKLQPLPPHTWQLTSTSQEGSVKGKKCGR